MSFEYLRNSALDARNFFDQTNGAPPFKRNQFGASLGAYQKRQGLPVRKLFASPNPQVFSGTGYSPSAGILTQTAGTSRQIQFALKLLF